MKCVCAMVEDCKWRFAEVVGVRKRGCIVSVADYKAVDAISEDEFYAKQCRFWNEGYQNWWLLSNVKRIQRPIPCRGNVGMWQMNAGLQEKLGVV